MLAPTKDMTVVTERTSSGRPAASRSRASRACETCHGRRVKCDAAEHGLPCTRCKQLNLQDCGFFKSKRGTHNRPNKRSNRPSVEESCIEPPSCRRAQEFHSSPAALRNSTSPDSTATVAINAVNRQDGIEGNNVRPEPTRLNSDPHYQQSRNNAFSLGEDNVLHMPDSQGSEVTRDSYRNATWTSMFEHILNNGRDQDRSAALDKCSITYLGETFPLTMVLEDMKQGGRVRLHHPGPSVPRATVKPTQNNTNSDHLAPKDVEYLLSKGSFDYPPKELLSAFTATFFEHIYPCYPIVNRRDFGVRLKESTVPWLLLQAFCFICSTFCPLPMLHRAKFQSRREARLHYYSRAKALFDTGHEVDKIVILQSVILLAFWAGGPNDYRNFYSWNSSGITIAEAMGIHRSMDGVNLKKEDASLLRRLWWVLVIRDASCGTLIGRPFRINMNYCDAEMLTIEDFADNIEDLEFDSHPHYQTFGQYQIHMAKLSLVLRRIIDQKLNIKNGQHEICDLNDTLDQWKSELPESLRLSNAHVFSQCLALAFDHHLIIANLDKAIFTAPTPSNDASSSIDATTLVRNAAQRILDLACEIVTGPTHISMPHECFPAIFVAEVVFYAQMRSPQPYQAALGRSAVTTCQMVWHNVIDTWDSAPWIMKMFDTLIRNANKGTDMEPVNLVIPQVAVHPLASLDASDMNLEDLSGLWQSHPMLPSMFNLPMDQYQIGLNDFSFMLSGEAL